MGGLFGNVIIGGQNCWKEFVHRRDANLFNLLLAVLYLTARKTMIVMRPSNDVMMSTALAAREKVVTQKVLVSSAGDRVLPLNSGDSSGCRKYWKEVETGSTAKAAGKTLTERVSLTWAISIRPAAISVLPSTERLFLF